MLGMRLAVADNGTSRIHADLEQVRSEAGARGSPGRRPGSGRRRQPLSRLSIFKELFLFLKEGKRWWLGPLVVVLVLLGMLLVLAQGSALAPFIYALF